MIIIEKKLLQTLQRKKTAIPIWFMRQAGRYLPEYRKIRNDVDSFLSLCYSPALAAEVTLQPIRRFDLDAAIIFSDILVIPHALGVDLRFSEGEGPLLRKIESEKDLEALSCKSLAKTLAPVYEAIDKVAEKLPKQVTLIGFSGSPWTLAAYMLEGKGSKEFHIAKKIAFSQPGLMEKLITLLEEAITEHILLQIQAGAEVIQLFDSWAGLLPETYFNRYVIEPTRNIVQKVKEKYPSIPIIGFPKGSVFHYLAYSKKTGVDAVSIDWQIPPEWVKNTLQPHTVIQGNLDPVLLFTNEEILKKETYKILDHVNDYPFIFNLGHGILPGTPIENVEALIKIIRNYPS